MTVATCTGNCNAGYDGSGNGHTDANCAGICGTGKWSTGLTVCQDCPAATYGATSGLATSTCTGNCADGKDGSGGPHTSVNCGNDCAAGKYSESGDVQCTDCPAGKYGTGGSTAATCTGACPLGQYQDQTGQTSCKICGAGSITGKTGTGATSCTLCTTNNTYSATSNLATCTQCADGEYQDQTGQISCKDCGAGSVGAGLGAGCSPCLTASGALYTDTAGTTSTQGCSICDPGSLLGAQSVTVGEATVNVGTSCTECQDDNYSNDPFDTTCTACAFGKVAQCAGGCTASGQCSFRSHMYGYVEVPDATNTDCTSNCQCEDKCVSWRGDLKDGFTIAERTSEAITVLDDSDANNNVIPPVPAGVDKPLCDMLKKGGRLIKQQGC